MIVGSAIKHLYKQMKNLYFLSDITSNKKEFHVETDG